MTEDVQEVESEETDETYSDEELWESDEESTEDAEPSDTEEEVEETEEEDESQDESYEDEEDEDPAHNYEKRYKDLEREFHRRNEESARMREELNDLRLRVLEDQQAPKKASKPADPTDADSFFNEDDRTTMDEFSEITGVTKKLIEHEVAKRLQELQPNLQKVDQMEQQLQDQTYNQFLKSHESYMLDEVGRDYRDIDKDPQFQNFVLASPALTKMMTESVEASDHASVMNLWLETTEHGKNYRPQPKEKVQSSPKQASRRKAASSLMTNSAPRTQKNPDNMSDEELWDTIPE